MSSTTISLLDEFTYHHVIAETLGVSLVFYTGPDCGSCHHLRNVLNAYLQECSGVSIFEVDAVVSAALVNEFNIFHLPSMFLYKDGQYHCEFHAEALPDKIHKAVEQALLLPAEEEP
ncbi:MAG TPA: thioredoxin [Leucothrix mucor]|nr:thioredoxin [Leucothrix mucor]